MSEPITKFVIVISGYTQDETQDTGSRRLWRKLHDDFVGTDVQVILVSWNHDMNKLAGWIRYLANGATATVIAACYSWGVGHGFIKLAKQLLDRDIKIRVAICADGVYHPAWYAPWRYFFVKWRRDHVKIKLPHSVLQVKWSRQKEEWPYGHEIVAHHIHVPEAIKMEDQVHKSMDETQWWHLSTRDACQKHFVESEDQDV